MNLKKTLCAALAGSMLCGMLPAAGAASKPSIEYDSFGAFSEITVTNIPGDHVHAVQLELTFVNRTPKNFHPPEQWAAEDVPPEDKPQHTMHTVETKDEKSTLTLYIDRFGDLNEGSTAFLGTLEFARPTPATFEPTGKVKLLDENLQPLDGADEEGFFHDVSVTPADGSGNGSGDGDGSGGGSGSTGGNKRPGSGGSSSGSSSSGEYRVGVSEGSNGSVRLSTDKADPGEKVVITVSPDRGYELDTLTVTDGSGKELSLKDLGGDQYSFIMPDGKVTVAATFKPAENAAQSAGLPFADVPAGEWYQSAVEFVYRNGMMSGTSANAFSPNLATSRAMIVSILYRLEGSPAAGASNFPDVPAGQYYSDAVAWAAANGIVSGYSNGRFQPNDGITREQLAAILYRYAQYKGYDLSATADLSRFADAASVSSYATGSMQWAVGQGLISGTNRGALDPAGGAMRAQAASILMRFCQSLAGLS